MRPLSERGREGNGTMSETTLNVEIVTSVDARIGRRPSVGRSAALPCAVEAPPRSMKRRPRLLIHFGQGTPSREKAEAAEASRIKAEKDAEEGRAAREAEDAEARRRERYPFYGMTLEVPDVPGVPDTARRNSLPVALRCGRACPVPQGLRDYFDSDRSSFSSRVGDGRTRPSQHDAEGSQRT